MAKIVNFEDIKPNTVEQQEQRLAEIMQDPNRMVITVAIPGVDEDNLYDEDGVNPLTRFRSGEEGCNSLTVALAIETLEEAIMVLKRQFPHVDEAREFLADRLSTSSSETLHFDYNEENNNDTN